MSNDESLMNQKEVAKLIGVAPRTLESWRYRGEGPYYLYLSKRCIRYRLEDINTWIEERKRGSSHG